MRWRERRAQLSASKGAAEEDVTTYGEELQRLDLYVNDRTLDDATQQDYRQALDAYDDAKQSLRAVKKPDQIRHVTEILDDGRYAVATVKARLAGEPLPVRRPPCFFDPAHGPSVQDVDWAPSAGSKRPVPACAADTQRVLAGADPSIRTVLDGTQRVPYWQAGPAYAPWALGYYDSWGGLDLLTGILIGSTLAETPADPDTGDSEGDGFISSPDDGAGETGDDGSFFE